MVTPLPVDETIEPDPGDPRAYPTYHNELAAAVENVAERTDDLVEVVTRKADLDENGRVPADQLPDLPGGGAVDSVNAKTGEVVLAARDVGAAAARRYVDNGMAVCAHRGAAYGDPENVIASLHRLPAHVTSVEVDVRVTSDGVAVLMHDDTVDRTTNGTGAVASMTLSQIKELDAGGGAQVPTLSEYLAACQGRFLEVILLDLTVATTAIVEAAVAVVEGSPLRDRCVLMGRPEHNHLATIRGVTSTLRVGAFGATVANADEVIDDALTYDAELVLTAPGAYVANRAVIAAVRTAGIPYAGASTTNGQPALIAATGDGLDIVLTDETETLGPAPAPAPPSVPFASGQATIADTEDEVEVVHGLAHTPATVLVTGYQPGALYVTDRDEATFTVARDDAVDPATFGWLATGVQEEPGWTPVELAGLLAWYDAQTLQLGNGDPVTTWADLSGNGFHLTPGVGNAPTYGTSILAGRPGVQWPDGEHTTILHSAAFGPMEQPTTIYLVGRLRGTKTTADRAFIDGIGTARNAIFYNGGTGAWSLFAGTSLGAGAHDLLPHVFRGVFNGATGSSLRVDDTVNPVGNIGSQGIGGVSLGNRHADRARANHCDIHEIIIVHRLLDSSEDAQVMDYLRGRWGW